VVVGVAETGNTRVQRPDLLLQIDPVRVLLEINCSCVTPAHLSDGFAAKHKETRTDPLAFTKKRGLTLWPSVVVGVAETGNTRVQRPDLLLQIDPVRVVLKINC
jgi:hypothetical protein